MALRVVASRVMRTTGISILTLLVVAFALVQFKQHLIRRDTERLLADFHSIHLNQTTWPEAQALMRRWGKLGHAHGPCNATDCAYDITVTGWPSLLPNGGGMVAHWLYRLGRFPLLLELAGVRFSIVELRFLVEDGAVRRTHLSLMAETEDAGYMSVLLVKVRSHASLDSSDDALNFVGADEELGVHPSFVVGPDSFCTGCETISLAYTPQMATDELVRLTSFNLSCLTWRPCPHLTELAPALMREDASRLRDVRRNSVQCTTPAWALGRDGGAIWLVDTVATGRVPDPDSLPGETPSVVEQDQVRLIKILKGPLSISPQTILWFRPYSGTEYEARAVPEHLTPGHRYIVMPSYEVNDWKKEGAQAWRCGVLEDNPANELAIQQGIALDDHLRSPELTGKDW